jgi:hypothetical protein
VITAADIPAKNPLAVDSGVLKSACASSQTTPQRAWSNPASTPWHATQEPAIAIGSCPAADVDQMDAHQ